LTTPSASQSISQNNSQSSLLSEDMYPISYIPESQSAHTLSLEEFAALIVDDFPPLIENPSESDLEVQKDMYAAPHQTFSTFSNYPSLIRSAYSPSITPSFNQYENASISSISSISCASVPHESVSETYKQESETDTVSSENHNSDSQIDWKAEVASCDSLYETAKSHEKNNNIQMAAFFFKETLKKSQWIWGDDHPKTLADKHNLAWIYSRVPESAEKSWPIMVDVLQRKIRLWGPDDPRTLRTKFNMACVYWQCGYQETAIDWHREIWEKRKLALGDDHDDTKLSLKWLQSICPQSLADNGQSIASV
jgi:hypothetical protein